jgi:pimeloyl-ACP methyl ester carboxylesterase
LPNGTLVTVADCGHNVHGQNTKGFIEALTGFLATLA